MRERERERVRDEWHTERRMCVRKSRTNKNELVLYSKPVLDLTSPSV